MQSKGMDLGSVVSFCKPFLSMPADPNPHTPTSGWDIHDTTYSRELLISNRANGYRDITAQVDLSTYRRIPWEYNVPFFLVSFLDPGTGEPVCVDPRGTIVKALKQAAEFGWDCVAGVEYEVSHDSAPSPR